MFFNWWAVGYILVNFRRFIAQIAAYDLRGKARHEFSNSFLSTCLLALINLLVKMINLFFQLARRLERCSLSNLSLKFHKRVSQLMSRWIYSSQLSKIYCADSGLWLTRQSATWVLQLVFINLSVGTHQLTCKNGQSILSTFEMT